MAPRIVAVCGEIGSGKSTVADHLVQAHGFFEVSMAQPLKQMCQYVFGLEHRHAHGTQADKSEPLDHVRGPLDQRRTAREILQHIGTEGFRAVDPDVWVKLAERRAKKALGDGVPGVVVPDARFENEFDMVRRLGGVVWLVTMAGQERSTEAGHASEEEWRHTAKDALLVARQGDLEGLRLEVDQVLLIEGGRRHAGLLRK